MWRAAHHTAPREAVLAQLVQYPHAGETAIRRMMRSEISHTPHANRREEHADQYFATLEPRELAMRLTAISTVVDSEPLNLIQPRPWLP